MIKSFFSIFDMLIRSGDIFAIKVESCQKLRKILGDFMAVTNFWGRAL